jgi:hypothetical protein
MEHPSHYRRQAARARSLASNAHQREIHDMLRQVAREYDEIATDIERGAVEIRHAELMPQNQR